MECFKSNPETFIHTAIATSTYIQSLSIKKSNKKRKKQKHKIHANGTMLRSLGDLQMLTGHQQVTTRIPSGDLVAGSICFTWHNALSFPFAVVSSCSATSMAACGVVE